MDYQRGPNVITKVLKIWERGTESQRRRYDDGTDVGTMQLLAWKMGEAHDQENEGSL